MIAIFGWWRWCLKQLLVYSDAAAPGSSRSSRCGCLVEVLRRYQRCVCLALRGESAMTTLTSEGVSCHQGFGPNIYRGFSQGRVMTRRFVDAVDASLQKQDIGKGQKGLILWFHLGVHQILGKFLPMSREFWDTEGLGSLLPWTRRFALVRALN